MMILKNLAHIRLGFSSKITIHKILLASFMCTIRRFDELDIHPYLKQNLKKNDLITLTNIQQLAIPEILKGSNSVVLGETGSGKTHCYAIPLLDKILKTKENRKSAPDLKSDIRGAIVLAPTKELCAQIYAMCRRLDPSNKITISRTGSIGYIAPIVQYMAENNDKLDRDLIAQQSIISAINWNELDLLISTPIQLDNILTVKDKIDPYNVNPKQIVIDEFDLLLGDENISKATKNILRRYGGIYKTYFGELNLQRQFILCGASCPKKLDGNSTIDTLNSWFKDLKVIKTDKFHHVLPWFTYENFNISNDWGNGEVNMHLLKCIEKSTSKKIIVFCNSAETVNAVCDFLDDNDIPNLEFYSNLSTEERINVLAEFARENYRVLVATDLASRGLDYAEVDHIIQYDYASNAISLLHRLGRTGRLGRQGKVTNFIRENDLFLHEKFLEIIANNKTIDEIFSRKRSLKKKEAKKNDNISKKYSEDDEDDQ